ncbi:MAG: hypothetical protein GY906_01215 [bacterium]|nr:hypothetical protein [bacterium]
MKYQRGMGTVPTVALAALAGILTAGLMMDWVVVDVETTGPDAVNLTIPFPLLVGRVAAAAIPNALLEEAVMPPEVGENRELVLAAVKALSECPDGNLVTVDAPDAKVQIDKRGDQLYIEVDADDALVHCQVPVKGIYKALDAWDWKTPDPGMAFKILASADNGELVSVDAEDVKVSIRIW